ncbi:MAG: hypothetical protein ACYDGM_12665 [Vulcanimicrobiaceae bacterium]
MQNVPLAAIREVRRLPSPIQRPQTLAVCDGRVWLSSRDVPTLYGLDERWHVSHTTKAPGSIWGLAVSPTGLTAVCGLGQDDDRYIYRYTLGEGFEPQGIACPDFTGCYVTYNAGAQLYLAQVHYSRVIALDEIGSEQKTFDAPRGLCGICWVRGALYLIGTDDENSDECYLSRLTLSETGYTVRDIARVPFQARSLAFDGQLLWSNHRDRDEIVAFDLPTAL